MVRTLPGKRSQACSIVGLSNAQFHIHGIVLAFRESDFLRLLEPIVGVEADPCGPRGFQVQEFIQVILGDPYIGLDVVLYLFPGDGMRAYRLQ